MSKSYLNIGNMLTIACDTAIARHLRFGFSDKATLQNKRIDIRFFSKKNDDIDHHSVTTVLPGLFYDEVTDLLVSRSKLFGIELCLAIQACSTCKALQQYL